jgi:RimJ/RimL family protein N-acetyltransferase
MRTNGPEQARVRLSSLTEADCSILFEWLHDRELRLHSGSFSFVSSDEHQRWFQEARAGKSGVSLAVRPRDGGELLGLAQLLGVDPVHHHAELRIKLAPDKADQGFGTEAVRLLCDHGFADLNLGRIFLYVFSHNSRAIATYRKVGFQQEGLLRSHAYADGQFRDIAVLGLLKAEYQADPR